LFTIVVAAAGVLSASTVIMCVAFVINIIIIFINIMPGVKPVQPWRVVEYG
jgi:hypothetical protein